MPAINPPVATTQLGHVDPNASPLTINEQIDLFNTVLTTTIDLQSFIPIIQQDTEPGVDDRDKVWIQIDSNGRPLALKIWYANGPVAAWRRIYNGMIGEIRGYSGNPGLTTDINDDFDPTGLGHIGGRYDGWAICNGQNGTPNLTDKFLIGAHMDNSNGHTGYNNGWQTFVDGQNDLQTGGAASTMITEGYLPELVLNITGKEYNGTNPDSTVQVLVQRQWQNPSHTANLGHIYGANVSGVPSVPQQPYPTLPPFYALAWIRFNGY